jgi:capsular exopolysaccharide synthesis family protein
MGLFHKKHKHSSFSLNETKKTLHKNLEFTATEQYKLLRANLEFTLPVEQKCPIIGVTSSMRGEGKSTTAVNLSYVLAEKGKKVLLIDGDLRIPSVAKKMEIDGKVGLTDFLMGRGADIMSFQSELLPTWYILPSGDIPPNPSELLGSRRMAKLLESFREKFDYIVIDLPPVNIVSDAKEKQNGLHHQRQCGRHRTGHLCRCYLGERGQGLPLCEERRRHPQPDRHGQRRVHPDR